MSHKQFQVSSNNPNETTGGGGCICDAVRQIDCKPPYAIFYGNDMESIHSPHVVICQSCAAAVVKAMGGEILAAGETEHVPLSAQTELPIPKQTRVTPTHDDEDDIPEV